MNIYDQLMANWEAGYYSMVRNSAEHFLIFSTKDIDNDLRCSGWFSNIKITKEHLGNSDGLAKDYLLRKAKEQNWKIIDTIHPTELMGSGMKPGQKVRVKENAKEECEKYDFNWIDKKEETVGKICEVILNGGCDYKVYDENKNDYWAFPPSALSPVYENDIKTTWLEEGKKNGWVKDGNIVV